jgi:hypothetical protein
MASTNLNSSSVSRAGSSYGALGLRVAGDAVPSDAAADVGGERLADAPTLREGRRSRSEANALAQVRLAPLKADTA